MSRQKGFIHSERTKRKIKTALRKHYNIPSLSELSDLYYRQGLTQLDIAKIYDRRRQTVIAWMKRYRLVSRRHKDHTLYVTCACGCGQPLLKFDSNGRARRFINGHSCSFFKPSIGASARKKNSESKKGDHNPMRRLDVQIKSSASHKGKPHSEKQKMALREVHTSEEYREKRRQLTKELWQTSDYVKTQMLSRNLRPNKPEQAIIDLAEERRWPLSYVGDGSLVIHRRCPDFHNGDHKVIEIFGDYWHRGQNPQEKIEYYKKYGYDCLVIWEHELEQKDQVVSRIEKFLGVPNVSITFQAN